MRGIRSELPCLLAQSPALSPNRITARWNALKPLLRALPSLAGRGYLSTVQSTGNGKDICFHRARDSPVRQPCRARDTRGDGTWLSPRVERGAMYANPIRRPVRRPCSVYDKIYIRKKTTAADIVLDAENETHRRMCSRRSIQLSIKRVTHFVIRKTVHRFRNKENVSCMDRL